MNNNNNINNNNNNDEKATISEIVEMNKKLRLDILKLERELLGIKLEHTVNLHGHYVKYWLDLCLSCYEPKEAALVDKKLFFAHQGAGKKLADSFTRATQESSLLADKIAAAKARVEQFKALNPEIVAEYRRIKDEVECQELIIEMSETNSAADYRYS